jgi:Tol biopolymer transport system component
MWTLATINGKMRTLQENTGGEVAISPDGMRIAFEKQAELWQMGANGETPARLADAPNGPHSGAHASFSNCFGLSWSPDGRWLTYLRKVGDTDPLVLEARFPGDGRTTTVLQDPDLRGYCWLSSTEIVLDRWVAPDRPFSNLWKVDVDPEKMRAVGKPRRLTNWAGFAIGSMSASRGGRVLAVTRRTDRSDIFIGELADHGDKLGQVHRISLEERIEWPGAWSSDSKWLLFQSDRTGSMGVFRQRLGSTNPEPLVTNQEDNRGPLQSPDRQWVLYLAWPRSASQVTTARLMRKPLGGGPAEVILEARGFPGSGQTDYHALEPTTRGHPAFRCPSEPRSSCVLSEAGRNDVVFSSFARAPSAAKSEIFRILAEDPDGVVWDLSPDGSRIAYAEHNWTSASIHIREVAQRTTRDIPLSGLAELQTLAWGADGESLFFTTFAVTGSSLFHVTLDGRYHLLYKGAKDVEAPRASPDGRYLAFGDVVSASNVWLIEGIPR